MRRLATAAGAALLLAPTALFVGDRLVRSWRARVAVSGHSMEPTMRDGDWLLVDPIAFARRRPRPGELVVARDPRDERRVVVKRVSSASEADGRLTLRGDHPAHAQDGERLGPFDPKAIIGKPWLRYWPPGRAGHIS